MFNFLKVKRPPLKVDVLYKTNKIRTLSYTIIYNDYPDDCVYPMEIRHSRYRTFS